MKIDASIEHVLFQNIPVKSTDVSPTKYCTSMLLKRALSMRKPTTNNEVWKIVEEECKLMYLGFFYEKPFHRGNDVEDLWSTEIKLSD